MVDLFSESIRQIVDMCRSRVCCIASDIGTKSANQFSGVLVRHQDRRFILTASHGVEGVRDWSTAQLVTLGKPGSNPQVTRLEPLGIRKVVVERGDHPDPDIALVELPTAVATSIQADFITSGQIARNLPKDRSSFLLFGFPSEWIVASRDGIQIRELPLVGMIASKPIEGCDLKEPFDPEIDFFFHYGRELLDGHVGPTTYEAPELRGVSGSPLFLIPSLVEGRIWNAADVILAGIQVSAIPKLLGRARAAALAHHFFQ